MMKALDFRALVDKELKKARGKHKPQASIHEGYAILLEEVDEFWEHVRAKAEKRNYKELLGELVQIASSAQKTAEDIVFPKLKGKKR
jgi:NTP pyrophosphatase (non-canonical NTP hydrolase)